MDVMRKFLCSPLSAGLLLALSIHPPTAGVTLAHSAQEVPDASAAFEMLKALEGRWEGTASSREGPVAVEYRVTAGGSVVIETMNEADADEMISIYRVIGNDLVMTHYCAAGNEPRLRLARARDGLLAFSLVGGEKLDPEADGHIHAVEHRLVEPDRLETSWTWFEGNRESHDNDVVLIRIDGEREDRRSS